MEHHPTAFFLLMNLKNSNTFSYIHLANELERKSQKLKKQLDFYAYLRLTVFALAVFAIWFLFDFGLSAVFWIALATVVAFLLLVKNQSLVQNEYQFITTKLTLVQNELNIEKGDANIYSHGAIFEDATHDYSSDLDIFGEHSLYAYINRCATERGLLSLAEALKKPANIAEIIKTQDAVDELANRAIEILDFRTHLFGINKKGVFSESFYQQQLPQRLVFTAKSWVKAGVYVFSALNPLLLVLSVFVGGLFWNILGLAILAGGAFYFLFKAQIDVVHEAIGRNVAVLQSYVSNIKWMEETQWQSSLLHVYVTRIQSSKPLHQQITELAKILNSLNARLNPIVGIFLNLFFQWDLRCLIRLARWERENKAKLIEGVELIGEFERLISLATLKINHPNWVKPILKEDFAFCTQQLGHPLIKAELRVANDFHLTPEATVDIITGSNMAGKSTFLRTVGINMVLAFAGAPVCANRFETSIFQLFSFMRIKDSLADGTSTFKAEIDRIKMILDRSATCANAFVLVDEMLRGTNSRDKYLGSAAFIKKLVKQQTPGLVATHDLQLAQLASELPGKVRNFHFDIQVNNGEMFFDYRIKNGECRTFNASILLKAIGLDVGS